MMIWTVLLAIAGGLGFVARLWWGKRSAEKRAASAENRAKTAEATTAATVKVAEDRAAGEVAAARVEEVAAQATDHPERAAAREMVRLRTVDAETQRRAAERVRSAILRRKP